MGERGPIPKRDGERRRRNKESKPDTVAATGRVDVPEPDEEWNPLARDWYRSLGESGQAEFFEPSDWQAARYVAEVMSRHLNQSKPSAQLFSGVWAALSDLLTTEAARRRLRVEVERDTGEQEQPAGVTALNDYRQRLG